MGMLFHKAEMTSAYLKMGIYGAGGTGKTHTASLIAKGLALHIENSGRPRPPVMFFDTEPGAHWVKPIFDEAGIEFLVCSTRAFTDLMQAVREAEAAQAILIVDSISHVWDEVQDAFLQRKRQNKPHAKLELPDWNVIKAEWGKFTSLYVNSSCHIVMCGRAGNVYEFVEKEGSDRKEMIATGTRMSAEKGLGYEPSLLVEMTALQVAAPRKAKSIVRKATILKDRSTTIDGRQFDNPDFKQFLPHIQKLNLGGKHAGFDASRNSVKLFPREERDDTRHDREILVEEIEAIMLAHYPTRSTADVQAKAALLERFFNTKAWTEVSKKMPAHELRERYNAMHIELQGAPSRYFPGGADIDDEIPDFRDRLASPAPESPAAPPPADAPPASDTSRADAGGDPDPIAEAREAGRKACRDGLDFADIPEKIKRYGSYKRAWEEGYQAEGEKMEAEMNQ